MYMTSINFIRYSTLAHQSFLVLYSHLSNAIAAHFPDGSRTSDESGCKPLMLAICKTKMRVYRERVVTWSVECSEHLSTASRLLVWEDQRLIPGAWLAGPLEPTACSLALLNTAR